jgi:hypothetical protein
MPSLLSRVSGILGSALASPMRLVLAGVDVIGGVRKLESRRQALRDRPPLDDDDFVESLDLPQGDRDIAIAVRDVVASACGVASTALPPDDQLGELEQLPELLGPPIDWSDLLEQIAERADMEIPVRRYDERTWGQVGGDEYVADLKHLVQAMIALSATHRSGQKSV